MSNKKHKTFFIFLTLLLTVGLPAPDVLSQTHVVPDDGLKRYLVELIVVQNNAAPEAGSEIWDRFNLTTPRPDSVTPIPEYSGPADTYPATPTTDSPTRLPGTYTESSPGSGIKHKLPLEIIPTKLDHLADSLRILNLGNQYQVLKHAAWIQPLSRKKEAAVVELSHFPKMTIAAPGANTGTPSTTVGEFSTLPAARVTGTVRMYENQLLFVEVDLTFWGTPTHRPGTFRIKEKRRVKLNELHYLDHPYYGALIRVSRWGQKQ